MEHSVIRDQRREILWPFTDYAEFIIEPAHRVRPLAGPMAGSGRTRRLHPGYVGQRVDRSGFQNPAVQPDTIQYARPAKSPAATSILGSVRKRYSSRMSCVSAQPSQAERP